MDFTKRIGASYTKDPREPNRQLDRVMQYGDVVVLYLKYGECDQVILKEGMTTDNKFGHFKHADIVGKTFGSKLFNTNNGKGYIYALAPTPELWAGAITTRTQIVNELDSSVCTFYLDLYPGCKVVESGTGSGCMSLSIIRAVLPTGHLYTYEYNPVRAAKVVEEFRDLGVAQYATVQCRDVCGCDSEGGGFSGVEDQSIDAVFLDLPQPWLAIDHAAKVLKRGKILCSYSPCIEQVVKTCETLRSARFHSIYMVEVRQRPFDGRVATYEAANYRRSDNASSNSSSGASTSASVTALELSEERKEEANNINKNNDNNNNNNCNNVIKSDEKTFPSRPKRPRTSEENNTTISHSIEVARAIPSMRGHTAFLTFAVSPYLL